MTRKRSPSRPKTTRLPSRRRPVTTRPFAAEIGGSNDRSTKGLASLTRQAVTKHLALLEDANLVVTIRRGREKLHYLNPVPLHEIHDRWIGKYQRSRLGALRDLKKKLEGDEDDKT